MKVRGATDAVARDALIRLRYPSDTGSARLRRLAPIHKRREPGDRVLLQTGHGVLVEELGDDRVPVPEDSLGNVATRAPAWNGEAGPGDLALNRPAVRDRVDPHAPQLPGHRERPVLRAGVGLQAQPGIDDQPAQLLGRPRRGAVRRARAALRPRLAAPAFLRTGPLADPPIRAAQRRGDLLGALTAATATDRFLAQILLGHHDLLDRQNEEHTPDTTLAERCPAVR